MIAALLKLITSPLAGPVASAASLVLVLALVSSCTTNKAKNREIERLGRSIAELSQNLGTCRANAQAVEASAAAQSRAVAAFAEEQARRQRAAETAASEAQRGRAAAEAAVARLRAHQPQGVDLCARVESADQAVLEALRP